MKGGSVMQQRRPSVQKARDERSNSGSTSKLLCECGPVRLPGLQGTLCKKRRVRWMMTDLSYSSNSLLLNKTVSIHS